MDKLSVVIVNYNAGDFLVKCLRPLKAVKGLELDIWVVDNASDDGSLVRAKKEFPKLNYIGNKENLGFGAANNQALRQIKTEFILTLNPDTEVRENTLPFMVEFMKNHPDVGAATCRALKNDGTFDWAYHRGFPTPWAAFRYYFLRDDSLYHLTGRDINSVHEVDAISGSFFLTRKSILDKIGLFDEDYWLYAEDLDLSYRIKNAGYKIMYVPDVEVVHFKGVSSGIKTESLQVTTAKKLSRVKAFNAFYETMRIFYKKNLEASYPFFINWMVYLAINLKWALAKRKLRV